MNTQEMNIIPLSEHAQNRAEEKAIVKEYPQEAHPHDYARFSSFLTALEAEKIKVVMNQGGQEKTKEYTASDAPAAVLIAARDNKSTVHAQVEGERKYAVVSGLTEAALKAMQQDGHNPATITETAQGKYQAVMKLSTCTPEQQAQIESTLCARYGDGSKQGIVIPGFYAETPPDRLPRVVKIDEAAQAHGAARLLERLLADAPRYREQEEATRAHAAQAPAPGIMERTPQKQEEQPAPGIGFGLGLGDTIQKFVSFFLDFLKKLVNLVAYALGKEQPFAGVGKIEDRPAAPQHWQKSPWNEQELTQHPVFAQKKEEVQEKAVERAPAQVQEQAQAHAQEETQARSRGRSR